MKQHRVLSGKLVVLALAVILLASFLLPTLNTLPVYGSTTVSGQITSSTVWTKANSPYIVTGNILIPQGVTLTIEPGVMVKFDSGRLMQVDGELIARGTQTESIVFTSNQPSPAPADWGGIKFTDSSVDAIYDGEGEYVSGSIMQYCTVEYGWGIDINKSSPFIDHCTIRDNSGAGTASDTSKGIYIYRGSPKITNNTITGNRDRYGGGIHVDGGEVTIEGNTITDNREQYFGLPPITGGGGIFIEGDAKVTIEGNIVNNNGAYHGGGISICESTAIISGNTISDNWAGGGIYVYGSWSMTYWPREVRIVGNTIKNNSGYGIYAGAGIVTISLNSIISNKGDGIYFYGKPSINYNNIYDNTPYDINNGSYDSTNATNNWWGTTNEATIGAHIYDWVDKTSLGVVTFKPYLTSPILPTASLSFTSLQPPSITTTAATYDAELTATGTNFNNVDRVTFAWSGPDSGTDTWDKGDSDWNSKVKVNSDTSMTLRPRILSDETSSQTKTWTWTVTLRDTVGATASQSFTVTYTPTSGDLNAIIQELTIDRVEVTVAGQSYFILTLEHRIDPTTLKVIVDSGQTKVYVDVSGNPVSDGEVAQKIGIIETAREESESIDVDTKINKLQECKAEISNLDAGLMVLGGYNYVISHIGDVEKIWHEIEVIKQVEETGQILSTVDKITDLAKTQPTGFLVDAIIFVMKKLIADPLKDAKDDLDTALTSALQHYESARDLLRQQDEITSYEVANDFLTELYNGQVYEEEAMFLFGKIFKNTFLVLSKLDFISGYLTFGLSDFVKFVHEAFQATSWQVETMYTHVVKSYEVQAKLLYKLTQNGEYTLELVQATNTIDEYEQKYLDWVAEGAGWGAQIWADYASGLDLKSLLMNILGVVSHSPVELRVYDNQGRVTGTVSGQVEEQIPNSIYDQENDAAVIFHASDSYRCEMIGLDEGAYGIEVDLTKDGEIATFAVTGVPMTAGAKHEYTIGWDSLSNTQVGVTTRKDSDGDGVFEEIKTLYSPIASFVSSASNVSVNERIDFDASQSGDADGEIVSYKWNFGDGNNSTGETATHAYSTPGEYTVSLTVVDNDGVVSTQSRTIQVVERQGMPTWGWAIIAIGILVLAVIVFRKRRTAKVQR